MNPVIEVLKPGASTTVQDLGRHGWQPLGMPVSGAMDALSHELANWAAGNPPGEATLEITLIGPVLRFHAPATIAWAGGDLSPTLDGAPLPRCAPVSVAAGATLQFGRRRSGVRAYLAVHGGLALAPVMGSRSTYARGATGGYQGRALQRGDLLPLRSPGLPAPRPNAPRTAARAAALDRLSKESLPSVEPLRVMPGREWTQFTMDAREALLATPWRIAPASDRMGYRLQGHVLRRLEARDMLSEAVSFGTVQVPPDGQPIVLMAERQTTGGYPRIAQVASADLPRLAQMAPGDTVGFTLVDVAAAQSALRERAALWQILGRAAATPP